MNINRTRHRHRREGDEITVTTGPFAGMDGIFERYITLSRTMPDPANRSERKDDRAAIGVELQIGSNENDGRLTSR